MKMNFYMRHVVGSLIICVVGAVIFIVACSMKYNNRWYYYDSGEYTALTVFFWFGIGVFIMGIINLLRVAVGNRRADLRGVVVNTTPVQPTVTVIGTRVQPSGYQEYQMRQQQVYPGQQVYPMQEQIRPPTAPPAYDNSVPYTTYHPSDPVKY